MTFKLGYGAMRRIAIGLALGVGVFAAGVAFSGYAGKAVAAASGKMSAVDRLIAEDEIRQQTILYGLYADGDAVKGKDIVALADNVMTPDAVSEAYYANGDLNKKSVGRDEMIKGTPPTPKDLQWGARHYMVSTYFDEITPTTAKTRTTALYVQATKNIVGKDCAKMGMDACGGRNMRTLVFMYHDEWVKTAQGWRKSKSALRVET